jgi:hypothetical protein
MQDIIESGTVKRHEALAGDAGAPPGAMIVGFPSKKE